MPCGREQVWNASPVVSPLVTLGGTHLHAIRLSTTEKARPMGFRPQMQRQLHTAFANKNDDELRDSGTQALKGKRIGFGMRVDITPCSSPHTDI